MPIARWEPARKQKQQITTRTDRVLSYLFCSTSQSRSGRILGHSTGCLDTLARRQGSSRLCVKATKKFINSPGQVVTEALDGLVACTPFLRRLDGYPHVRPNKWHKITAHFACLFARARRCCGGSAKALPSHDESYVLVLLQVKVVYDDSCNDRSKVVAVIAGAASILAGLAAVCTSKFATGATSLATTGPTLPALTQYWDRTTPVFSRSCAIWCYLNRTPVALLKGARPICDCGHRRRRRS